MCWALISRRQGLRREDSKLFPPSIQGRHPFPNKTKTWFSLPSGTRQLPKPHSHRDLGTSLPCIVKGHAGGL